MGEAKALTQRTPGPMVEAQPLPSGGSRCRDRGSLLPALPVFPSSQSVFISTILVR